MYTVWLDEEEGYRDLMTTSSRKQAEKFCDKLNEKFGDDDLPVAFYTEIDDYAALGEERIPYTVDFNEDGSVSKVEVAELGLCLFKELSQGGQYTGHFCRAYVMAWDDEHAIELAKELREKKLEKLQVKVRLQA